MHDLNARNLLEILNPTGVTTRMIENYAPVQLLAHALEWRVFGANTYGYHVVNVVLHAAASLLLLVFFRRTGIPAGAALAGAAIFLVHTVNVEAVAWISQLKSSSALLLALAALLLYRRRPLVAAALFGLGLLAKPSALFALPVLVVFEWSSSEAPESGSLGRIPGRSRGWIALWVAIFAAYAAVELLAFSRTTGAVPDYYQDTAERVRSGAAIGLRYLVMVATTHGLSTFHEPAPVRSWIDPWWLGSVLVFALMGWRILVAVRRRSIESVYWAWAAAAFAPVSSLMSIPYPMADRYLYFILPGLIGLLLMGFGEGAAFVRKRVEARGGDAKRAGLIAIRAGAVAAVLGVVLLAARSHDRARIWQSSYFVLADAELHYPDGAAASLERAERAARAGNAEGAVKALRAARARGWNRLDQIYANPAYASIREDPVFRALIEKIAGEMLEHYQKNPNPSQHELQVIALAHYSLKDLDAAIQALERALEIEGPISDQIRQVLVKLRAQQRREALGRSRD